MKLQTRLANQFCVAIALALTGFSCFVSAEDTIWSGANGVGHVASGGYWFGYADSYHGGLSTNNFPTGSSTVDSAGISAAQNGGMFDITFTINPAPGLDWPYVGIGFDWSIVSGTPVPQAWTTVCLEYSYTGTVPLKFQIKDDYSFTKDNDYSVMLAQKSDFTKVCYALTDFKQNAGNGTQTIADCMTNSIGMQFIGVMAKPATPQISHLKLKTITSSQGMITSNISTQLSQGATVIQSGRTLALQGFVGETRVRLYNTTGVLMAEKILSNAQSMNVNSLPVGVYLMEAKNHIHAISSRVILP